MRTEKAITEAAQQRAFSENPGKSLEKDVQESGQEAKQEGAGR
jgi:hypothetical protein